MNGEFGREMDEGLKVGQTHRSRQDGPVSKWNRGEREVEGSLSSQKRKVTSEGLKYFRETQGGVSEINIKIADTSS